MLAQLAGTAACKDDGSKALLEDASFGRRVFRPPPTGEVRAVPPHNIHGQGVGPYELSASFQKTLALLPNGPRVERFESDGLFDYRLMRTDNDALLLGVGRRNRVNFISVLDPDIARTESGVGVGAGVDELVGALGAVRVPEDTGRDPRIVTFTALPDTRFIVEKGTVIAAVITEPADDSSRKRGEDTGKEEELDSRCKSKVLSERKEEILAMAGFGSAITNLLPGCLGSESTHAVVQSGEWIKIIGSQGEEAPLKLMGKIRVPGLLFAALLNTGGAGVELYSVAKREDSKLREVVVTRYRVAGGRIAPAWSQKTLKLKASAASWLGAKLEDTDFFVELRGRDRVVEVSGIFVQRKRGVLRNVIPINPVALVDSRSERRGSDPAVPGASAVGKDAGPLKPTAPTKPTPASPPRP